MPLVKICGLSTPEAIDAAIKGGASHVGFVFYPPSPRDLSVARAQQLAARVPAHVAIVAVLVDPARDLLAQLRARLRIDVVQLHGAETPAFAASLTGEVWKAIPVRTRADLADATRFRGTVARVLYDAKTSGDAMPGGMGLRFDWTLLDGHRHPLEWGLSGGLTPDNLGEALRVTGAPLVDVSSGVESAPGVKDMDKIVAFLNAAQS